MSNEHRWNIYIIYVSVSAPLTRALARLQWWGRGAKPGSRFRRPRGRGARGKAGSGRDEVPLTSYYRGDGGRAGRGMGGFFSFSVFFFLSSLYLFIFYFFFLFSEFPPPPDYWFWYSVKAFSPEIYRCRPVSRAHIIILYGRTDGLYAHTLLNIIMYIIIISPLYTRYILHIVIWFLYIYIYIIFIKKDWNKMNRVTFFFSE